MNSKVKSHSFSPSVQLVLPRMASCVIVKARLPEVNIFSSFRSLHPLLFFCVPTLLFLLILSHSSLNNSPITLLVLPYETEYTTFNKSSYYFYSVLSLILLPNCFVFISLFVLVLREEQRRKLASAMSLLADQELQRKHAQLLEEERMLREAHKKEEEQRKAEAARLLAIGQDRVTNQTNAIAEGYVGSVYKPYICWPFLLAEYDHIACVYVRVCMCSHVCVDMYHAAAPHVPDCQSDQHCQCKHTR